MKPESAVALIESAYRTEVPAQDWLQGVAASASTALSNLGAMVFQYNASERWVDAGFPALHLLPQQFAVDFFDQKDAPPEAAQAMARVFLTIRFGSLREVIKYAGFPPLGVVLDRYNVDDMIGVNGLDPSGRGCMLAIVDRQRTHSTRTVGLWHRLGAHVAAGNRMRVTLERLAKENPDPTRHAEAILSPTGKIEHAVGPAEPRPAREALREALVRIDAARAERDDPERSVELWRGLVAGRWSLVEHFERDGRRYYLAHKNDPELAQDRTLTSRERQVLGYAELGSSNKLTAYALGLSTSTISTILARAKKKLGISKT